MRAHLFPSSAALFTSSLHQNPRLPRLHLLPSIDSTIVAAAKSRWDYDEQEPFSDGRFGFGLGLEDDGFDGENQRTWWSDGDDDEFGFDEDDTFWLIKIFRSFGWMLPAIGISLLLGSGSNTFIMALAVPLGQTVISFAFNKLWGFTMERPKPKVRAKTRKTPSSRSSNDARRNVGKEKGGPRPRPRGSYQSWVSGDGLKRRGKGEGEGERFGGWDDLDGNTKTYDYSTRTSGGKEEGSGEKLKAGKLSRVGRVRERPLLIRLLIAAFPFLGSWMRLFF
ncbi:hypothetical protein SAY86_030838 [Trapa natans]|uniref:Transmembrane protein n=1 Tax=Trapa natans TaxID=22666 RepID=A0AAN7RD25_TRANT|nr:hypothetical protein SAY86_030838 [Trapa natans]